jgi:serine palmitoyltransferase
MDNPILSALNQTLFTVSRAVEAVPGSDIVINYIKNSYQNDPFRVVLELGLAIYAVKYMMSKKYRIDHNHIPLTEKVTNEKESAGGLCHHNMGSAEFAVGSL